MKGCLTRAENKGHKGATKDDTSSERKRGDKLPDPSLSFLCCPTSWLLPMPPMG